mgnify:CR=1 FL=1
MQVELIKALQKEKKISNTKIAELTGISESTISRILARKTEPKFEDVVRIAVVLGASLDALAGIVRNEAAEEKELRAALEEKEAQLEAQKEAEKVKIDFLKEQISVRDRALEQKDRTIDGLMEALLRK